MNVLINSAGRRVSLVRFFKDELRKVFPDGKVYASDANPLYSAACREADDFFQLPRVNELGYIDLLLQQCISRQIRLIIPTIDTELLILAQNREKFEQLGISIVISDADCVSIFRDKRKTHEFFTGHGIGAAKEFSKDDYQLPIYIKPYDGSRSVDNYVIREQSQLTDYHFENPKLMFLEYLDHKQHVEFTIDLYYDKNGKLKCFIPRRRIEVRDGEVNKAVTQWPDFADDLYKKMADIPGFRGCITFQVFVNQSTGALYGIEINPRFGGGYPLSYLAGGNFPKWLISEYLQGEQVAEFPNWEQNLMMLRYDDEVLVRNFEL